MMRLDHERLAALENEFKQSEEGLELPNFIWLLQCAISHPDSEKFELVRGLIKLFNDIDINGDENVEWSEFTQYIIDAVVTRADETTAKGEKDFNDGEEEHEDFEEQKNKIERAYVKGAKEYVIDEEIGSNLVFLNSVQKIKYSYGLKKLGVLESQSSKLKFFDLNLTSTEVVNVEDLKKVGAKDTSFIVNFDFCDEEDMLGYVTSSKYLVFRTLSKLNNIDYYKKFDFSNSHIKYLKSTGKWITVNSHHHIVGWDFEVYPDKKLIQSFSFRAHNDIIKELIEIPKLELLVTCSLDGFLKFWNLRTNKLSIKCQQPYSSLHNITNSKESNAILGMAYSENQDHYIIAWGFSYFISIWNPFLSLTRPYCNTYSNHNGVIKYAELMNHTSSCISIDSKYCMRIWDVRTLETAQVVLIENQISLISNIHVFKNDSFLLAGKKIRYVLNQEAESKMKFLDNAYPIFAEFNSYFKRFIVVTKFDIRIYDPMRGVLNEVYTNLLTKNRGIMTYIMSYSFGPRDRKFYIGDNTGSIRQYNTDNAQLIKKVNNLRNEKNQIFEYLKKVTTDKTKRSEFSDITSLLYLPDDAVLVAGTSDSVIKIYDEGGDVADGENLLKFYLGGHIDSEITALAYNDNQGLLASGASNGTITIWDVINTKMEFSSRAHYKRITKLEFGINFPVLIAASMDGSISVWGHKPADFKFKHKCIMRFMVFDYEAITLNRIDKVIGVTDMHCCFEYGKLRYPKKCRNGLLKKSIGEKMNVFDKFEKHESSRKGFFFSHKEKQQEEPIDEEMEILKQLREIKKGKRKGTDGIRIEQNMVKRNVELIPHNLIKGNQRRKKQKKILNSVIKLKEEFSSDPNIGHKQNISMNKFLEMNQNMAKSKHQASAHFYVYLSTTKGDLHVCDLGPLFEFLKIKELKIHPNKEREDKIKRMENLSVSKQVKTAIDNQKSAKMKLWPTHDFFLSVHNFTEKGVHKGGVTLFQFNKEQEIFISGGMDSTIKIWDKELESLGNINICEPSLTTWNYEIDWIKIFLEEFEEVFDNLEIIEGRNYDQEERDQIINEFLEKYYVHPALISKKSKKMIPKSEQTRIFYEKFTANVKRLLEKLDIKFKIPKTDNPLDKNLKMPILYNYELCDIEKIDVNPKSTYSRGIDERFGSFQKPELVVKEKKGPVKVKDNPFQRLLSMSKRKSFRTRRREAREAKAALKEKEIKQKKLSKPSVSHASKMRSSRTLSKSKAGNRSKEPLSKGSRNGSKILKRNSISLKKIPMLTTDKFVDDFKNFNKKNSRLPELRSKAKKKDDTPISMIDYAKKSRRDYSSFMGKLTNSYVELGKQYKIKYKGRTSRVMRHAGKGNLYSMIKSRKFKNED